MNLGINPTRENVLSADVNDFLSVRRGVIAYSDEPPSFIATHLGNALRGNYFPILEDQISFSAILFPPVSLRRALLRFWFNMNGRCKIGLIPYGLRSRVNFRSKPPGSYRISRIASFLAWYLPRLTHHVVFCSFSFHSSDFPRR